MADLVELAQWEKGVYQLETSDPVVGGPDGIDNRQAKQLANRTGYLKAQQEAHVAAVDPHPQYATLTAMQAAINALVAAAPGALDTLKELAAALGDDPNFATTMTNALALKAALDSPIFSGTPRSTTPAQFDNSTRLTTSEWVNGRGAAYGGQTVVNAVTALTAAAAGRFHTFSAAVVATLPAASSVSVGALLHFQSIVSGASVVRKGTDVIAIGNGGSTPNVSIGAGDTLVLMSDGVSNWIAVGGSTQLGSAASFGALVTGTGYQKLPSGLILQWGSSGSNASGVAALTLPISFPNALILANCNYLLSGNALGVAAQMSSLSTKSVLYGNVFATPTGAAVNNGQVWFIAIGF
ncbi:hypothetical protein M0D68_14285 [Paraburkholderia sp. SEWSISQ10-3 4]|uniref:gp53-like domain-containing protein n=1 Tax=Paraburkholderia TaxID=1822464 RepID=UPI00224DC7D5|nr:MULTISPECIES: hypothetical protein [Paraburkholderia]MCX4139359.1 hypothetical protein [Paraburkholderia aspalathi]MDN7172047.1 hypothetical protein [Paraburkholderia sp. SEWSISQ10-3 4]MDQ6501686.1 hypothetical protein [Paraburkholderia aspalathi]